MLGILVRPQDPVGVALSNPVLVHPSKQIRLAVALKPLVDGLALVRRHGSTGGSAIGSVGAGLGIILAAQVTVLSVGSYNRN